MPRPISRTQLDKLGRRLARDEPISDDDYRLLQLAAGMYQADLDSVEERLRDLGFPATTRVKTTGTLVDKLRRTNLSLASTRTSLVPESSSTAHAMIKTKRSPASWMRFRTALGLRR
jgi:hypothetical protein